MSEALLGSCQMGGFIVAMLRSPRCFACNPLSAGGFWEDSSWSQRFPGLLKLRTSSSLATAIGSPEARLPARYHHRTVLRTTPIAGRSELFPIRWQLFGRDDIVMINLCDQSRPRALSRRVIATTAKPVTSAYFDAHDRSKCAALPSVPFRMLIEWRMSAPGARTLTPESFAIFVRVTSGSRCSATR